MKHRTVIAADIAKSVFQCVKFHNGNQIGKNKAYKRADFEKLITESNPSKLVMETCSGAQHWARLAKQHGHEVVLIPPRVVTPYRQGQKTDHNDALAIYEASQRTHLKASPQKTLEHQELAVLESVRARYQKQKTRLSNAMRGHLAEFGIVFARGYSALKRHIPRILEDAENQLPIDARFALSFYWEDWLQAQRNEADLNRRIARHLNSISAAKEILKIEGMGPVTTSQFLSTVGDGLAFKRAKETAAFIGTSPKQFSSGGKEVIIGISKTTGHKRLRSALIQGAWSIILKLRRREAVTDKERWLGQLIERVGEKRAAVALANKNVRTAWALLTSQESYQTAQ